MIRTILTGASALAVVAGGAFAQDIKAEQQIGATRTVSTETVAEAPTLDAKAVTTKDDAKLFAVAEFNIADINADGKIDQEEFIVYAAAISMNAESETVGDRVVSAPEASAEDDLVVAETDATEAPEQLFAEISEGEETIDQVKMVEARIADFNEADANDDEKLDESEKVQFAALVIGKKN